MHIKQHSLFARIVSELFVARTYISIHTSKLSLLYNITQRENILFDWYREFHLQSGIIYEENIAIIL